MSHLSKVAGVACSLASVLKKLALDCSYALHAPTTNEVASITNKTSSRRVFKFGSVRSSDGAVLDPAHAVDCPRATIMASQRFSGRELAERVSSSTEVLNSYDVRLSTSATVAKKPSQKASLSVCSFFDMRQRTRFTFHKLKSRKVLHDIVVVDTQEDTTTKYALVMAKGYDFNEVCSINGASCLQLR